MWNALKEGPQLIITNLCVHGGVFLWACLDSYYVHISKDKEKENAKE